ncbi:MAG: ECF transporter S component [Bacteroidales bacterium]
MTAAKLYSLSFRDSKTYLIVALFALGNLLLPQACHLFELGGPVFLPIYFFTLIVAYKYGITAGVLTAVVSPIANSLLFGMPPAAILPEILIKSVLLAIGASFASGYAKKISFLALLCAILFYQTAGSVIDYVLTGNLFLAIQDFRVGFPGLLFQLIGGFLLLKAIRKI